MQRFLEYKICFNQVFKTKDDINQIQIVIMKLCICELLFKKHAVVDILYLLSKIINIYIKQ